MSPDSAKRPVTKPPLATWRDVPATVWTLGFVSLLMDVSSELVHSLLPVFLTTVLGASAVVGVDLDPDLLARARDKAPDIEWVEGDLSHLDLGRVFDVVVAAGNVFGFIASPARAEKCSMAWA